MCKDCYLIFIAIFDDFSQDLFIGEVVNAAILTLVLTTSAFVVDIVG